MIKKGKKDNLRKHAFVHILKEEKTNMDQKAIALAAAAGSLAISCLMPEK